MQQDLVGEIGRRNVKLNNYYETFRRDMISILGNVKMPGTSSSSDEISSNTSGSGSVFGGGGAMGSGAEGLMMGGITAGGGVGLGSNQSSKEDFDSYFSKLQTICTDNVSDENSKNAIGVIAKSQSSSTGLMHHHKSSHLQQQQQQQQHHQHQHQQQHAQQGGYPSTAMQS